jgi:hypothetical protein
MRADAVLSGVMVIAAVGYVGYRQHALELKVDALTRQLGAAEAEHDEPSSGAQAQAEPRAAEPAPDDSHAARLAALEAQLTSMRADVRSLEKATGDVAQPVSDQQIMAVMRQRDSKVIDAQLKFHRDKWLEKREDALNDFGRRYALTPRQNDELWELLGGEVDKLIDLMRRPDLADNPERATQEWRELLRQTDAEAHQVLEPLKALAWDQQREAERKLLWPWLPQ